MKMPAGKTLRRHIIGEGGWHNDGAGDLLSLLEPIALAGKILAREIDQAALAGTLGLAGDQNATGDMQKKLDVLSNEIVMDAFAGCTLMAGIASEELSEAVVMSTSEDARYLLCTDPLDGSSNTDVNAPLGTIFGILQRSRQGELSAEEFLQKGSELVCAGYVLYGTSTVLVYTVGSGVHGFTLDRGVGEFMLSHEDIRCPDKGTVYSANVGRHKGWDPGVRKYLDYVTDKDKASGRPHSLRYTGALVADLHRCLLEGGVYFYPGDPGNPNGKLRLLYECAPLACVAEQAGGAASTGKGRLLDVTPEAIHQRMPIAVGSVENVALYERFVAEG